MENRQIDSLTDDELRDIWKNTLSKHISQTSLAKKYQFSHGTFRAWLNKKTNNTKTSRALRLYLKELKEGMSFQTNDIISILEQKTLKRVYFIEGDKCLKLITDFVELSQFQNIHIICFFSKIEQNNPVMVGLLEKQYKHISFTFSLEPSFGLFMFCHTASFILSDLSIGIVWEDSHIVHEIRSHTKHNIFWFSLDVTLNDIENMKGSTIPEPPLHQLTKNVHKKLSSYQKDSECTFEQIIQKLSEHDLRDIWNSCLSSIVPLSTLVKTCGFSKENFKRWTRGNKDVKIAFRFHIFLNDVTRGNVKLTPDYEIRTVNFSGVVSLLQKRQGLNHIIFVDGDNTFAPVMKFCKATHLHEDTHMICFLSRSNKELMVFPPEIIQLKSLSFICASTDIKNAADFVLSGVSHTLAYHFKSLSYVPDFHIFTNDYFGKILVPILQQVCPSVDLNSNSLF